MKRYIAVCTPDVLKFKDSRRRAIMREFAPDVLSAKEIFTEEKAAEILENRQNKSQKKDEAYND